MASKKAKTNHPAHVDDQVVATETSAPDTPATIKAKAAATPAAKKTKKAPGTPKAEKAASKSKITVRHWKYAPFAAGRSQEKSGHFYWRITLLTGTRCERPFPRLQEYKRPFLGVRLMLAKLNTFALVGIEAVPVQVEVDASAGLPKTPGWFAGSGSARERASN
jgi:hypothetical protein